MKRGTGGWPPGRLSWMDGIGVNSAELVVQLAGDILHCWVMGVTGLDTALEVVVRRIGMA